MTLEPIFVRIATTADLGAFSQHQELATVEASKYRGAPFLQNGDGEEVLVVAGVGNTVLASLRAVLISPTTCAIEHVFVEAQAREIGIGDELMRFVLQHCRALGSIWISGSALPGDRAMKNLFERHGLVAQTILVGKSLNDPSTVEDAFQ